MLRKLAVLFWTTALLSCACFAQYSKTSIIIVATAPAGSCTNGSSPRLVISSGNIYTCQSQTWAAVTGAGSMTWPGAAGIPNYNGASAWGTSYSATNSIPANFLPAALSSSTSINGISVPGNIVFNNQANTYSGGGLQDLSAMKLKPPTSTVAGLPTASSNTNVVYEVTDGASATDCTTGGGSTRVWCSSNGVSWVALAGSGGGGSVSVNGSSVSNPNFNDTTPVAGVNGINVSWQQSSGNVSAEIVGDGNVAHCLIGTGLFSACPSGGANTALSNLVSPALNAAPSPGTDASISLDDLTHRYVNAWLSGVLGWTNGAGTADTGFSRDSAGVEDLGNGAAGDTSGSLKLTSVQTVGSNGGYQGTEGTGASVSFGVGKSGFYPDSTLHGLHGNYNNVDVGCLFTTGTSAVTNGDLVSFNGTSPCRGQDASIAASNVGLKSSGLNQFASTTSAQLAGVISDETGTGPLVFATDPLLTAYWDVTETAAPANPGAGNDRLYLDSTSHVLTCLTSAGASCMPSGSSTGTYFAAGFSQNTIGASTTNYEVISGAGSPSGGTGNNGIIVPAACTAQNGYVRIVTSQPASGSLTVALYDATTSTVTAMSVTIAASSTAGVYTTTGTPTLTAGDSYVWRLVNAATAVSGAVQGAGFQCK